MAVTVKNLLGIVGLAVITLFWVALSGVLGGVIVAVLIVLVVITFNIERRRRKRPAQDSVQPAQGEPQPSQNGKR